MKPLDHRALIGAAEEIQDPARSLRDAPQDVRICEGLAVKERREHLAFREALHAAVALLRAERLKSAARSGGLQ